MSDTAIIKTEQVSKVYNSGKVDQVRAVDDVSVAIKEGDLTVIKGPSGSGKTSLLSLLGCMCRPTSGRIIVGDRDVAKLPEKFLTEIRRDTFGFIFQQFNLVRDINVTQNVTLPLYPSDMDMADMATRACEILDSLDILSKKSTKVRDLSGGEQQRVAIARALVNEPGIILADEPTAHLDTNLSEEFIRIMKGLNEQGKTIIIATHDPLVYDNPIVNTVIEMRDGKVTRA
ncbi:MAG: ABC transporter ATP-binding protein [Thermodesulfobacteriota bacterium]